jgi:catechol 2,3-dioxygenase-like lactoylglutathione lyase family enzyme
MSSIDHVTIRVADVADSLALYSRVFELLGLSGTRYDGDGFHEWNDFSIARADDEHPPTRGLHIAFAASDHEQIDRWWSTLTGEGQRESFTLLEGTPTENLHLAIGVGDRAAVAAFHLVALEAGGRDNGGPGERPQYHPGYYAAYIIDPDGNNVEAVWHNR